jgi:acyl-CoA reductase-like NAD-dependent aldehyde dehydrogenase
VDSRQNGEHAHEIVHFSPRQSGHLMWRMPVSSEDEIDNSVREAKEAARLWRFRSIDDRLAVIMRLADLVENNSTELSRQISSEIGKPLSYARGEITYATALLRALPHHIKDGVEVRCGRELGVRYRPLGTVALITPWNNPVAIPLGKIAPALLYGNAVVWKPAPFASKIATAIMDLLQRAEIPEKLVNLVLGYGSTAYRVMEHRSVDAVSITGSSAAGYVAQDVCGRRHIPLQAELGGNNASIIWSDCDVDDAAEKVAEAAFGFSGQRCTANRRAIVDASCYQQFVHCLERATARLSWGDPLDEKTRVGPVISQAKCTELAALVTRAQDTAESVLVPHKPDTRLVSEGPYFPPTIVRCDDPQAEIVQEESFGPILVVQRADNWNQAIELCNGVKQGLVASLFSQSENRQSAFLDEAQSGILKLNSGTSNAAAEAPFGGWKASGVGPPEHGSSDREFYTRTQTIYR